MFRYVASWLPLPVNYHIPLADFSTALGYKDLEPGICFGIQRMGTQAVCARELDVFNDRVKRIYRLWKTNQRSYSEMVSNLTRELSEAITAKDTSRIESAVDLMAFAECVALAQTPGAYNYLIDEEKVVRYKERMSTLRSLTYSQKIEALGGLETIGIAIDQYSVETFEKYITELKTLAKSASVEFLILQLGAEGHAVTIIYSPKEECWYCIDVNNLPIKRNGSDQKVAKWVFERYNSFYSSSKKRLLISTNVQLLGKDLKCSQAFQNWREIQEKNRLLNLTPEEVNKTDDSNTAPLQAVAKLERLSGCSYAPMLCSLLDRGADPNHTDKSSFTPLMNVVIAEDTEAVKVLLGSGANVNIRDKEGWTALMLASRYANIQIVKALLEAGADLEVKDNDNSTALILAANYDNTETVKALLEAGANPDVKDNDSWTALTYASRYGNTEMVRALLEKGADPNIKTKDGWTALTYACRYGNTEMVRALLEKGADLGVKSKDNRTALMLACRYGNSEMVKALLEKGADLEVKTKDNWTALMLACRYGNSEMVKALLEKGADPSIKSKDGWTALGLAKGLGNTEMVEALLAVAAN